LGGLEGGRWVVVGAGIEIANEAESYAFKYTKVAETNVRTNRLTHTHTHRYSHRYSTHTQTLRYSYSYYRAIHILFYYSFPFFYFTLLYFTVFYIMFFFSFSFFHILLFSHLWQTKGTPAQDQRIPVNSEPLAT